MADSGKVHGDPDLSLSGRLRRPVVTGLASQSAKKRRRFTPIGQHATCCGSERWASGSRFRTPHTPPVKGPTVDMFLVLNLKPMHEPCPRTSSRSTEYVTLQCAEADACVEVNGKAPIPWNNLRLFMRAVTS